MKLSGNTVLITGGGTGIGRGLAEALYKAGNKVIIAGRRQDVLDEACTANPGMESIGLDVADAASVQHAAEELRARFADLNVLINMAGVMEAENLATQTDTSVAERAININLLGTIRMTTAFLPILMKQPEATLMNVSSGLATVPLALTPTYSATKAAIHSYTDSLRYQLQDTKVEVIELTPPYVGTELMPGGTTNPAAMPLPEFIAEVMQLLAQKPTPQEILVQRVLPLRNAVANGSYAQVFKGLNDAMKNLAH